MATLYQNSIICNFGEGNGNPLQYSCLENPMDRGAWWATVHGVAKSRTRLSDFTFLSLSLSDVRFHLTKTTFGIAELSFHRGDQTGEVPLDDVVVGSRPHRPNGDVLADIARNDDERQVQPALVEHLQGRKPAERGEDVVRDDDVPFAVRKRLPHGIRRLDPLVARLIPSTLQLAEQQERVVLRIFDQ